MSIDRTVRVLCLVALAATGCGKRETPARQTSPAESVEPTGLAVAVSVPQSQGDAAPAVPPVTEAVAVTAPSEAAVTPTPRPAAATGEPAPTMAKEETARQVSALVRIADVAARASPAGSQAWARVVQAQAAYDVALHRDAEFDRLSLERRRIVNAGPKNAAEAATVSELSAAMAARQRAVIAQAGDASDAKAALEQARQAYGDVVQMDARYMESVKLMKAMETNGTPQATP